MVCSVKKMTIAVGRHRGKLREMAHRVKIDSNAISEAARLMSKYVFEGNVLVPIPSHTGDATYTYTLANEIAKICNVQVVDALQGFCRESSHEAKLHHRSIDSQVWFYRVEDVPSGRVILIDNCVATGKTIEMARKALHNPNAICLALTLAE